MRRLVKFETRGEEIGRRDGSKWRGKKQSRGMRKKCLHTFHIFWVISATVSDSER
jgi:hypothetical protein